jgi:hypothetical protein
MGLIAPICGTSAFGNEVVAAKRSGGIAAEACG